MRLQGKIPLPDPPENDPGKPHGSDHCKCKNEGYPLSSQHWEGDGRRYTSRRKPAMPCRLAPTKALPVAPG